MPIDAEIALNKDKPKAAEAYNPLAVANQFMDLRNKANENKLFNQTFEAKQQAGKIMADAPDLETGLQRLMKDPLTAPFAGEIVTQARAGMLAQTQQQGEQGSQNRDAFQSYLKSATGALDNPTRLPAITQSAMAVMHPEIAKRVGPAIASAQRALLDDLPTDPTAAKAEYNKRLVAQLSGAGVPGEAIGTIMGRQSSQDLGDRVQPTVVAPITAGGGESPVGNPFTKGIPAQLVPTPSGAAVPFHEGPQANGGPTNALGGTLPAVPGTGNDKAPAGGSAPRASGNSATTADEGQLAGDGTPLLRGVTVLPVPKGVGGIPVMSKSQQVNADALSEHFNNEGVKEFNAANQTKSSLVYMDNALDTLAKGGGFLVPGTLAQARVNLGKAANTFMQVLGTDAPPFDPGKIASAEDFNKQTRRMGVQVIQQMLGGAHHAADTINGMTASVPGLENTLLGGKLVGATIGAASDYAIDLRNFQNAWQERNQGNLAGSVEAFNKSHPAERYAQKVLDRFGLNENGFKDAQGVINMVNQGYMTKDQAKAILETQFPNGPGGKK